MESTTRPVPANPAREFQHSAEQHGQVQDYSAARPPHFCGQLVGTCHRPTAGSWCRRCHPSVSLQSRNVHFRDMVSGSSTYICMVNKELIIWLIFLTKCDASKSGKCPGKIGILNRAAQASMTPGSHSHAPAVEAAAGPRPEAVLSGGFAPYIVGRNHRSKDESASRSGSWAARRPPGRVLQAQPHLYT